MASEDTERYKNEMQAYNGRQEAKMRSEALKPPVSYAVPSGVGPAGRGPEGYPGGPGDMSRGPGPYAGQMGDMSGFGNPAAAGAGGYYGGMEFGGYGAMGMGAYGMGYGGYAMGAQ